MDKHMSPEGLEEAIKAKFSFMITLTQGEKFRLYVQSDANSPWLSAPNCFNTEEEARVALGYRMTLLGDLLIDPLQVISAIHKAIKKDL